MENQMSPSYRMELMGNIESKLWDKYTSYKKVEQFIRISIDTYVDNYYNNVISYFDSGNIDLSETLGYIANEFPYVLLKIAIDLGIETPDYITSIPTFRNKLKTEYMNASTSFEKAFYNIEKDPAESIGHANSVLESIIKEILKDTRFSDIESSNMTNSKLVKAILRKFDFNMTDDEMPHEVKSIGSALTTVSKSIEDIRSDKTLTHGQSSDKYLINEPLYAYFVVNACSTVGLFLINFYEKKFPKNTITMDPFFDIGDDDLPF